MFSCLAHPPNHLQPTCREPPLLACVYALSASPQLLPVLGDHPSATPPGFPPASSHPSFAAAAPPAAGADTEGTGAAVPAPSDWAQKGMGSSLMRSVIGMLAAKSCSEACRTAVLDVVDNVLEAAQEVEAITTPATVATTTTTAEDGTLVTTSILPGLGAAAAAQAAAAAGQLPDHMRGTNLLTAVLGPWLNELLVALKSLVTAAWEGRGPVSSVPARHGSTAGAAGRGGAGGRGGARRGARGGRNRAHRELAILEQLGGHCSSPETAALLGDALASLVASSAGVAGGAAPGGSGAASRRAAKAKLDEYGLARALGALAALWGRLARSGGLAPDASEGLGVTPEALWR